MGFGILGGNSGNITAGSSAGFDVEVEDPYFTRHNGLPDSILFTMEAEVPFTIRLGGSPARAFAFEGKVFAEIEVTDGEQFRSFTITNDHASTTISANEFHFNFRKLSPQTTFSTSIA